MFQEGLTKQIIATLGLELKYSTPVDTPADAVALGRDVDGKEASRSINYASVVLVCFYILGTVNLVSLLPCAVYSLSKENSLRYA